MGTVIRSTRLSKETKVLRQDFARNSAPVLPLEEKHEEQNILHDEPVTVSVAAQRDILAQAETRTVHVDNNRVQKTEDDKNAVAHHEELRKQIYAELQEATSKDLQSSRQIAMEEGYAKGYQDAQNKVQEEHANRVEMLNGLISTVRNGFEERIEGLTDVVIELAFVAVTKIVGDALIQRKGVAAVVGELISRTKATEKLVVHVSPQDYKILDLEREQLLLGAGTRQIDLIPDDRVVLGGCLLETSSGNIDGRLEVQLQHFAEALLAAKSRWPDPDLAESK